MRLPGLVDLVSLILILATGSKGQSWDVNVTRDIFANPGSTVIIPCAFTYPQQHYTSDVKLYWKIKEECPFVIIDNDRNAFVYHSNDSLVLKRFRGKTSIIGNKDKGNCTLMIQDIDQNETSLYLRLVVKGNQYSFVRKSVSVTLLPKSVETDKSETTTISNQQLPATTQQTPPHTSSMTMVIAVTVAVVLVIVCFIGGFLLFKNKCFFQRSEPVVREASGHSKSFDGLSTTHANNRNSSKLSENNVTDEPVYINTEAHRYQMRPTVDHADSIYANL